MNRNFAYKIVFLLIFAVSSERTLSDDVARNGETKQIQIVAKNDANITAVSNTTKKQNDNSIVAINKTVTTLSPDNVTTISNVTTGRVDGGYGQMNMTRVPRWWNNIKSGALERTGLVVLAIISLFLVFFLVHTVRIRNRRSKSRKYGVIASTSSELELEPLERTTLDDDDEETLFDARHNFRIK